MYAIAFDYKYKFLFRTSLSLFPFDVTGDCSKNRYTSIIHYCCCYQNTPYNPQIRKFFMKAGAGDAGLCKKNTMN